MMERTAVAAIGESRPAIEYAHFGSRLSAFLIDVSLTWFWAGAFVTAFRNLAPDPRVLGSLTVSMLLAALVAWSYFVLTTLIAGGTLGKRLMRLRVVTTGFDRPDLATVLFREVVGRIIVTATLFIGYLWAAADGRKQGWHDRIADTLVVRRVSALPAPDPWEGSRGSDSREGPGGPA